MTGSPERVPGGAEGADPRPVVGPVVRDLTARRLARAGIPLVLIAALSLVGLVVNPDGPWAAVLAGSPAAALGLLALGMRGVVRAYGGAGGWGAVPALVWLVPWGWGVFVLGGPGLLELSRALAARSGWAAATSAVFIVLGIHFLRTSARVGEVARLGGVMGGGVSVEEAP